ncbi:MAG: methyl-accepting chemotaxis protein [Bacteroidales bacterium]|nr:methyl-accepting chemotaxis protein [Bacteroidales bacterium]
MDAIIYGSGFIWVAACVCWVFMYWFFKKTFVLFIGTLFLGVIATVACFGVIIGAIGIIHLLWAAPVSIAMIIGAYFVLATQVQQPIVKLNAIIQKMANNDLSITIDQSLLEKKMEVGSIARSVEQLKSNSNALIHELQDNSIILHETSEQLVANSQLLTKGASVHASNLEEISASIEEMGANIRSNAHNVLSSSQLSEESNELLKDSYQQVLAVSDLIHQMDVQLKSIKDIAETTNILAINASIESVKSGKYGKGFSVVAKEVRSLAEQSKEIGDLVIERSHSGVENMDNLASEIQVLVSKNNHTLNSIKEVAASSEEMNIGAQQINSVIQELNSIGQENAAASEELSSTAEQINAIIEQLNKKVSLYKLTPIKD